MNRKKISWLCAIGKTAQGGFACIPDHDAGCHLSHFKDRFWNTERLIPVLGVVDAVTVAQTLYTLADRFNL
ncbi:DUF6618 family protein [Dethiobacter alkaliphilus]|uniref:DUF6618 family protein n=1 Tax=Dethiobacter alkaliphilus TaxID=427926 RepID=UPI0037C1A004